MTSAMGIAYHSYPATAQAKAKQAGHANAENGMRRGAFARYLASSCAVGKRDAELALVAVRLVTSLELGASAELPGWVQEGADELVERLQAQILNLPIADEPWPDALEDQAQAHRLALLLGRDRGLNFILDTVAQHGGERSLLVLLSLPYVMARALSRAVQAGGIC
jgi:hypothetical protein